MYYIYYILNFIKYLYLSIFNIYIIYIIYSESSRVTLFATDPYFSLYQLILKTELQTAN